VALSDFYPTEHPNPETHILMTYPIARFTRPNTVLVQPMECSSNADVRIDNPLTLFIGCFIVVWGHTAPVTRSSDIRNIAYHAGNAPKNSLTRHNIVHITIELIKSFPDSVNLELVAE